MNINYKETSDSNAKGKKMERSVKMPVKISYKKMYSAVQNKILKEKV
jgi:hypothetical protein